MPNSIGARSTAATGTGAAAIIDVRGATRHFGAVRAVDGVYLCDQFAAVTAEEIKSDQWPNSPGSCLLCRKQREFRTCGYIIKDENPDTRRCPENR
jgi:hypothetical protein